MDKIQGFGKNFAANFTPFAARSQQYLKEQLGQADDKVTDPRPSSSSSTNPQSAQSPHSPALTSVSSETADGVFTPSSSSEDDAAGADASAASSSLAPGNPAAMFAGAQLDAVTAFLGRNGPAAGRFFVGLWEDSEVVFAMRRLLTIEKTQLPTDYLELEKRVDALKQVHQKMLAVT